ncbi:MAG TPA: hypothetical protein VJ785_04190 [Anaerolineales bacterium]|nr:hypothetical protein [Anaerolineales bacterium]
MIHSKPVRNEQTWLFIWLIFSLMIGALTVHQYGMSIDEPNNYRYAADTLAAYPSLFGTLYEPKLDSSYQGHGPAFVAMTDILIRIVQSVFPNVFAPDLWHFSYFITLLLTGLCLYWLTKRWFSKWTAWGILLLFCSQPLLLGHAFINPKDIPFMFFFTLSVVLGFHLVDGMEAKESFVSLEGPVKALTCKFQETNARHKNFFITFLFVAITALAALVIFSRQIDALLGGLVTYFYTAGPDTWAGQIFNSVASQASNVTIEDYITKTLRMFRRVELGILSLSLLFFLVYFFLLINNTTLSAFLANTWKERHSFKEHVLDRARSLRSSLSAAALKAWLAEIIRALGDPRLLFAGVILGLATAVRAIAPLAGMIVFFYLFIKVRSRAWTTAIAYFLVAGIMTYLAWPYLWNAPIQRYLEEVGLISNFQYFSGQVLFDGRFYGIRDLPRSYLPILLSIQFTEPLVLSVYIGFFIFGWRILRNHLRTDLLLDLGIGFVLPLFALILLNSPLYHNFRQVLFVIPAMFVLAAFTFEVIFSSMVQTWARLFLIAAITLPGIYSTMRLYPYQYVYYNSLVGSTAGVRDRYEMDYWRTSMRAMALELNELAPPGAKIIIGGSSSLFRRYARPDLIVETINQSTFDLNGGYDYAVQIARWQKREFYPDAKIVVLIERAGATLATVKAVKNASAS